VRNSSNGKAKVGLRDFLAFASGGLCFFVRSVFKFDRFMDFVIVAGEDFKTTENQVKIEGGIFYRALSLFFFIVKGIKPFSFDREGKVSEGRRTGLVTQSVGGADDDQRSQPPFSPSWWPHLAGPSAYLPTVLSPQPQPQPQRPQLTPPVPKIVVGKRKRREGRGSWLAGICCSL